MAVYPHAIDFLDVFGKEFGDILVGRPVDRHAEFVAVLGLEAFLQVRAVEPVLAEPVEIRELLVGQLVELAVGTGGEGFADEIVYVEHRVGNGLAFPGHPVGQVDRQLQPRMGADQVRIVDIGVIEIALGLHLGLHRLHDLALAEQLVVDLDTGNFLESLGQGLGFVFVGRNGFRQHVDFHTFEGLGGIDEPLHFLELFRAGQ